MICAAFVAIYSLHFSGDFNNRTPGAGLSCQHSQIEYSAMVYRNSIRRDSLALSVGYRFALSDSLSMSPFVGVASGYYKSVVPVVGLSVRYDNYQFIFLPPSPKSSAVINFSYLF